MKSIKIISISFLCISILFTGCATKPSELTASFVSPGIYNSYDCQQVSVEMQRYTSQVADLTGKQQKIYTNDQTMGLIGTFLLWPLYLFIKGDGEIASQLQTAKGTLEALQQVSVEKKCGM